MMVNVAIKAEVPNSFFDFGNIRFENPTANRQTPSGEEYNALWMKEAQQPLLSGPVVKLFSELLFPNVQNKTGNLRY